MRILMVQESDWLKRGPHDQHHLAEKLSLRGHEVHAIDFAVLWRTEGNGDGLFFRREVFNDVSKIYQGSRTMVIRPGTARVPVPGFDYLSLILSHRHEIKREIKGFAPDVIIGLGILNSYLAIKAARESNIPFISYWLDPMHELIPFRYFRPLGKAIERKTIEQADAVLTTNRRLKDCMVGMGAPAERSYVLQHGINLDRFNPELVDGNMARDGWGIKPDDVVIVYVGRLSRITGVREVASGLTKIPNHNLKFLVVGTGSREGELRQMQKGLGLQEKLIITGRRPFDEIPGLLAASDICVLPFHSVGLMRDSVPVKVFDYMSMRKPVISTRLPGMVEEFGEDNGVVYVDRPEGVIAKALELVAEGNLEEIGAKGRKYVERQDWDIVTDEFENILVNVVRGKRGKTKQWYEAQ